MEISHQDRANGASYFNQMQMTLILTEIELRIEDLELIQSLNGGKLFFNNRLSKEELVQLKEASLSLAKEMDYLRTIKNGKES